MASLWGVTAERVGEVWRVESGGATIALAAPAGGERERPCEIVTPPIALITVDAWRSCSVPLATWDSPCRRRPPCTCISTASRFRRAAALANVVRLFGWYREPLRELLGHQRACRRLAPLPPQLLAAVDGTPTMAELRQAATSGGLSKFFDVNLTQLLRDDPLRDTLEVRILPGSLDAAEVVERAAVVEAMLERCCDDDRIAAAITNFS